MPKHIDKTTQLLNVDLDIYSRFNLEPLVAALASKVFVLYIGRPRRTYEAHLELSVHPKSADAAIRRFAALIRSLPKAPRKLWDTAKIRDFNIGVQVAMAPFSSVTLLAHGTVQAAADLKARIVFTIYAPEMSKKSVSKKRPKAVNSPRTKAVR